MVGHLYDERFDSCSGQMTRNLGLGIDPWWEAAYQCFSLSASPFVSKIYKLFFFNPSSNENKQKPQWSSWKILGNQLTILKTGNKGKQLSVYCFSCKKLCLRQPNGRGEEAALYISIPTIYTKWNEGLTQNITILHLLMADLTDNITKGERIRHNGLLKELTSTSKEEIMSHKSSGIWSSLGSSSWQTFSLTARW